MVLSLDKYVTDMTPSIHNHNQNCHLISCASFALPSISTFPHACIMQLHSFILRFFFVYHKLNRKFYRHLHVNSKDIINKKQQTSCVCSQRSASTPNEVVKSEMIRMFGKIK